MDDKNAKKQKTEAASSVPQNHPKIRRLDRTLCYKGSILDVYRDTMDVGGGRTEKWDFVSHRNGAAAVVPVLDDGNILMVRQYRSALDRKTLEIPAGARDNAAEDTAVCAARELEEETGYKCTHLKRLLSLRSTVAFCDELIDVYLATKLVPGTRCLDDGESIELEAHPLEKLLAMIYAGQIQDAKTVAGILAYAARIG